ncbi:hypothetical protein MNBD_ALPHA04-2279, partial [hydrothermal vent metagenome]
MKAARPLLALACLSLLSGCVAALLPLAAMGTIGKTQIDRRAAKRDLISAGAVDLNPVTEGTVAATETSAKNITDYTGQGGDFDLAETDDKQLSDKDYLSRFFKPVNPQKPMPYADFTRYALAQSARFEAGEGVKSAVLVPRVALEKPETINCAGKPLAVLIDLDDQAHDDWANSEILYRQNGLAEALNELRAAKISVIWLSDAPAGVSERISATLKDAGLSASEADDFLFLDRGGDDRKQARRWDAARTYCIVAMAGDKRADFDELYDYLRHPDGAVTLEHMYGAGW